jgi:hypothetical protein
VSFGFAAVAASADVIGAMPNLPWLAPAMAPPSPAAFKKLRRSVEVELESELSGTLLPVMHHPPLSADLCIASIGVDIDRPAGW